MQECLIPVLITVFMAYWALLCIFASELTNLKTWLRLAPCLIEKSDLEQVCLATVVSDAGNPHKMKFSIFCVLNHIHFHNIWNDSPDISGFFSLNVP